MLFSTRAFELLKSCVQVGRNIAIFDFNYRDNSTQLSRYFFAPFRTTWPPLLNILGYQCVVTRNSRYKFYVRKKRFFGLYNLSVCSEHRCFGTYKRRKSQHNKKNILPSHYRHEYRKRPSLQKLHGRRGFFQF